MTLTVESGHGASNAAARAAIIQTLPLFEMMRMRAATTARRHPTLGFAAEDRGSRTRWVNHFTHTHRRLGPDDREVVSPNNDTVYSNTWLDLSEGPVVIETPDMGDRYWTLGLLDAWTNPFAYVGRRTTGNRPQRTLVHGPGWRGTTPEGVSTVIAAPGEDVWIIGRILVDDAPADLEDVRGLQAQITAHRLDGSDAAMRVDTRLDGRSVAVPPAAVYRAIVDEALARNPVPQGEALHWPIPEDALAAHLPRVFDELREKEQPHALGGGWALPVAVRSHWGQDVLTRARGAQPDRRAGHRGSDVSDGGSGCRRRAAAGLERLRAAVPAGRWPARGRVLVPDDVPAQRLPVRSKSDQPLFDRRPHTRPAPGSGRKPRDPFAG